MNIPHFDHVFKASPAENGVKLDDAQYYHRTTLITSSLSCRLGLNASECHNTQIIQALTCVKGGHMKGPEPRFWMCEYPVEKKKIPAWL